MFRRLLRRLVIAAVLGALVAKAVKVLRGDPMPDTSRHPTTDGGDRSAPGPAHTSDPATPGPVLATVTAATTRFASAPVDPQPVPPVAEPVGPGGEAPRSAADATWRPPTDGACPEGFPVKAKLKSGIFHLPGMLAYERTSPDRCYPDAESAVADGLRPAKR